MFFVIFFILYLRPVINLVVKQINRFYYPFRLF